MGMILQGAGGDIWVNVFEWGKILRLGQLYGWVPAGTILDEPNESWNGGYLTNDWQHVTANDARNLADALSRALLICLPMKSCGVFQFRSNYRQSPTIYRPIPLSIALRSKTLNVSRRATGSVAMKVAKLCKNTLTFVAPGSSLSNDATEQIVGAHQQPARYHQSSHGCAGLLVGPEQRSSQNRQRHEVVP